MSQDSEPHTIPGASLIPDVEVFSGYLETMANIEINAGLAPEADVPFHQLALEGVKSQAREYLESKPELIAFYKAVGVLASPQAQENLAQEIRSSEQLISYIQAGLLDSLTIEALEDRIKLARFKTKTVTHQGILEAAFSDLLQAETATIARPVTRKPRQKPTTAAKTAEGEPVKAPELLTILCELDMSDELRAFVRSAAQEDTKLLSLRKYEPAIASLTEEDYKTFKSGLTAAREGIVHALRSKGIEAIWYVMGATRGTTYRLVVADAQTAANEITPVPKTKVEKKKPYHLEKFSADLFKVTQFVINSDHPMAHKQSYISERIAEWLDITPEQASELVDRQVVQGWLAHTGTEKGTPTVEIIEYPSEPVEIAEQENRPVLSVNKKLRTRSQPSAFTDEDLATAQGLFELIATAGNHDKGVGLQKLCDQLGLDEREARSFITRLAKVGVCKTTQVLDETVDITRGRKTTLIKFPSKGAWSRFKANPADYLSILPIIK